MLDRVQRTVYVGGEPLTGPNRSEVGGPFGLQYSHRITDLFWRQLLRQRAQQDSDSRVLSL